MSKVISGPLVLDASVLINLLATGRMDTIVPCVCTSALVLEEVVAEVKRNPRDRKENPEILNPFFAQAILSKATLSTSDAMLEHYLDLVSADGQEDLGDGEAASIAYAVHHRHTVALDERKAIAVCRRRHPELQICSSLDILQSVESSGRFTPQHIAESVYDALRFARMRVPTEHDSWVRSLLNAEQLNECPSMRRAYSGRRVE